MECFRTKLFKQNGTLALIYNEKPVALKTVCPEPVFPVGSPVFDKLVSIGPELGKTQNTKVIGNRLPDIFHEEC